jgi:hypothetical protein
MPIALGFGKVATGGDANPSSPETEYFVGDGATTAYVISESEDILIHSVFVGGQRLKEGTHYTKSNTTKTVTFLSAVSDGVDIDVEYFTDLVAGAAVIGASAWGDLTGTVTDQADLVAYIASQIVSGAWGDITGTLTDQTDLVNVLSLKAPLDSPVFTGTPSLPTGTTAVTQPQGDNSTKPATTEYVDRSPASKLFMYNNYV